MNILTINWIMPRKNKRLAAMLNIKGVREGKNEDLKLNSFSCMVDCLEGKNHKNVLEQN